MAHSVVAPFGDCTAMLVSVKVENLGSAARKLAWVEQWGRLGARVRSNGADDTMRGYRHSIERSASTGGGTILLDTVMSPAAGTALSGSISTVLTVLSWIFVGIHSRRALPSPVCA